jgi:hypothetical protein
VDLRTIDMEPMERCIRSGESHEYGSTFMMRFTGEGDTLAITWLVVLMVITLSTLDIGNLQVTRTVAAPGKTVVARAKQ